MLLGTLPASIFLGHCRDPGEEHSRLWPDIVPLELQVIILVLATIVCGSTGINMVALALVCAVTAWIIAAIRDIPQNLVQGMLCWTSNRYRHRYGYVVIRNYVREGRREFFLAPRVHQLSFHREWLFGNMHERYDCTKDIEKVSERGRLKWALCLDALTVWNTISYQIDR